MIEWKQAEGIVKKRKVVSLKILQLILQLLLIKLYQVIQFYIAYSLENKVRH